MGMAAAQPLRSQLAPGQTVPLRERLLLVTLFVTVLTSSIAFIEPSPHDALMGLLAVACLMAGVRFERKVVPLILLLMFWNVAGLLALLNVPTETTALQYEFRKLENDVAHLYEIICRVTTGQSG